MKEYNYTYDEGNLVRAVEYDITMTGDVVTSKTRVVTISYVYTDEGELLKKRAIFADGSESSIIPARNAADNTDSSQFYSNASGTADFVTSSETDGLGRKTKDYFVTTSGRIERSFTYHDGEVTAEHVSYGKVKGNATTELVDKITYSDGRTTEYEYDAEERITKVTDSIDGITEYTYDSLGQLLTEKRNGVVINSMTYDGYGNIKSKNGSIYTYGNSTWKDLLTYCKGKAITYDAQGNPTSYRGNTLVWEKGRQLKSFGNSSYTYNANGIRTSKTVNGVKHTYVLDGTRILRETWDTNTLVPLYDNENSVCGISFNGNAYYFIKNLQGDVIALAAANKTIVARYTYDAWGVCTVTDAEGNENTVSSFIGNINPYRYRGYYYDVETGLYYLQSRYYNPSVGRFINGDDRISPYFCLTTNLYSYTLNSPVIHADYMGHDAVLLFETTGARDMGHAALLVEDSDGTCYYFSVDGKGDGAKKKIDFLRFGKNINIKNLKLINGNIYAASQHNPRITYRKYNENFYFKGDFSKSYEWFYNLYKNPDNYNFINNNCIQTASHALNFGTCKGNYASEYQLALEYLKDMIVPNSANHALHHFKNTIEIYDELPWYKVFTIKPPYYYFSVSEMQNAMTYTY